MFLVRFLARFPLLLVALVLLLSHEGSAFDPAAAFLAEVDSLAAAAERGADDASLTGDASFTGEPVPAEETLVTMVSEHNAIVGAAVGQLVERAIDRASGGAGAAGMAVDGGLEGGDAVRTEATQADLRLARRLAEIYQGQTGSRALLDLVATYSGWGSSQLALRREAKDLERQATAARTAGDPDRAIALLDQAMKVYESIGDVRSIAVLWGTLGIAYWAKADFEGAATQYDSALAARRGIEDRILEGRTLNGLGSANYQLGRIDQAIDYYRQAIALRTATGDTDGLATSLTYLGNAYIAAGRTLDARKTLEQALPMVEQTGNEVQHYEILTSIASLNAEMGRMASCNDALHEALVLAQAMVDPRREMICRNNLAFNLANAYRYGEALEQLEALKTLLDEHPDPKQAAAFYGNRGFACMRIGELEAARADFNALLNLSEEYRMPVFQLEALIDLGHLSEHTEEPEQGLAYAERALALAQEIKNPKMAREALVLAGQIERNLGRYESSAARWNAAWAIDAADSLQAGMARDRVGLASVYVLAGRNDEAREILRDTQPAVELSQDGDLIVASIFCVGHSFERSDPESARFHYERGLDMLDKARADIGGAEVRTGYLGGLRRSYFEEVATYYAGMAWSSQGGQATGSERAEPRGGTASEEWSSLAFRTIERAKARGLLDMLGASALSTATSAEEALLDSLYVLDPSIPGFAERERRLKDIHAQAREARVASLGGGGSEAEIVGPDEICEALPKGTALLEFALGDTMSLVWVVDRAGYQVFALPKRAAIQDAVARLRDAIAHPVLADDALRRTAHEIYTALVSPTEGRLKKAKDLVIVPDGVLFELPFEVLLTEEPTPGLAWSDLPYLARRHSVTYAPSASTYLALRGRPKPGGKAAKSLIDLVVMGDPDYSRLGPLSGLKAPLEPLPHTRTEVASIAAILRDKNLDAYVGREANEAILKTHLRDHPSRIVHLAAHGLVDLAEPAASSVALCPDPAGTEDGYLRTLEVMSSPMDVGLVVLSACESGRGEIGRGEGIVGFGRAFLAAGARTIVASLWAVSDESTAILMETFYQRMAQEKRAVGRALNEARLALMADARYSHPYYWSPFVVMGCEYKPW